MRSTSWAWVLPFAGALVIVLTMLGERAGAAPAITEFPVPTAGSTPFTETRAPDGNLWFVEQTGNNVGRITPAGVITEFPIPTAASMPFFIIDGPDGNLWFTEQQGNKIGRVTMAGQIAEFPIPTANSNPQYITVGPDGNLWFTESIGNKIGRVTTDGTITEFTVPTANSQSQRIIPGDDGNLWFTEFTANKIGRITTAGVITEFTVPTASSQPQQIVNGPDGNLWFVEQAASKIGRITHAGGITEFPLPAAGSQPSRLLTGRDNNIWFTEVNHARIGQITPAGVITEFPIPSGSNPNRLSRGRDANLWFTETSGNRIGRITYAGVITEFPVTTANSGFNEISTSYDGNLWYVGTTGNVIGRVVDEAFNSPLLAAAILPASRSIQVGGTATAFAVIVNASTTTAQSCLINDLLVSDPETFTYQPTNPANNVPILTPNTPVDIPAGQFQTFVISLAATGPFAPADLRLGFSCANIGSAPFTVGVNTLLLSASNAPVPDVVALAATLNNDGIVNVPGATGTGFFVVATVNVGIGAPITASADTGSANPPVTLTLCETDPSTSLCKAPATPSVTTAIGPNGTPTFAIFVAGSGNVPFDPGNSRVFVRFKDAGGATRGATSVAVRTQ